MKILAVDDDSIILGLLTEVLERAEYGEVQTCTSAERALEVIAETKVPFDCFLLDIQMGGMDGIGLCARIRDMPKYARTPILMLTAMSEKSYIDRAFAAGATDYLSKPADANDITNALLAGDNQLPPPPENPMSADRVRWEHIQRVYELCDRNVSETARRLNMHRRTLQRILAKRSPR